MAGPNFVLDKGFTAGGAITKYLAVEIGTGETVTVCNGANDRPIGIAQETATAGDATNGRVIDVRMLGISRCIAGGNITIGDRLNVDATGKVVQGLVVAGTVYNQVGIALQAGASGDHIDVFLTIGATYNTAVS